MYSASWMMPPRHNSMDMWRNMRPTWCGDRKVCGYNEPKANFFIYKLSARYDIINHNVIRLPWQSYRTISKFSQTKKKSFDASSRYV